jgi:hypothetical protein
LCLPYKWWLSTTKHCQPTVERCGLAINLRRNKYLAPIPNRTCVIDASRNCHVGIHNGVQLQMTPPFLRISLTTV